MTASFVGLLLGIAMGARHALDPDHLAAVSVLAADAPGARRGALLGAMWGLGHAIALLATGLVVAALAADLPPALCDAFELVVALMLVILGGRAVRRAFRDGARGPSMLHAHRGLAHVHPGLGAHLHVAKRALALRPLIVGVVHGLAGSGALTALVLARMPSTPLRLTYIALFGIGSVVGMSALSGLAGWPLAQLARRPSAARLLFGTVGAATAMMGLAWGWPAIDRLF